MTEVARQQGVPTREQTLWERSLLLPGANSLLHSLERELSDYTGEPLETTSLRVRRAREEFAWRWQEDQPTTQGEEGVTAFYNKDLLEAYELSCWHGGGFGVVPLHYAIAGVWLKNRGAKRVLDFGSGIGSGAIVLSRSGLEVDLADIAKPLLAYAHWRMARREIPHRVVDLNATRLKSDTYDAICCFDVLEHVADPACVLAELTRALRVGGVLLCHLYTKGGTDTNPMHISSFPDPVAFVVRTGIYFDWSAGQEIRERGGDFHVLRKRRFGGLRNLVRRAYFRMKGEHTGRPV